MDKQNSKYRWIVFTAVLFTYFLIVSQRTAPGLITDQLMKDFNVSASTIGLLTSIQFLAYASLQIPIGILSDRYGPNLFLIAGALLNGLGTLIYSAAPNEFVLLVSRALVGMGDATIWVNLVLILGQWFRVKEFVGLLGFAGMAGSLGFLLATYPFSAWIAWSGWRPPFFTVGILLCLCGILLYVVLVKRPNQLFKGHPEAVLQSEQERVRTFLMLKRIFSDRQAWATFFCHFGLVGTYVGFIGSWAVPYGMQMYGMSRSEVSQLMMIGLVGAIVGASLTTWIANRLESIKRPYMVVHLVVLVSWIAFLVFGGKPPFFMLAVLFFIIGYGNGASALTFAAVRQSFAMREVGVVSGFANTGGFISAILLPSIYGKVLDHFQPVSSGAGYTYGFIIPVVFAALGVMGGFLLREQRKESSKASGMSV
ncbi:MFS transporter [Paenibacillus sabinae]|uniref:Major facilitator superfamily protein n=1 Tax=Paenibacillus sabinae T27 TaxID=1268072 RepID=X4ZWT0_9BACL|nr:MFS transporter [Paenibacillus sabinae]AHV96688.1 major facilitator superfamily protein [Paenibacillus sabinae T27]